MTHLVYIHESTDHETSAFGVLLVPAPTARRSLEQLRAYRRDLNARHGLLVHAVHRLPDLLADTGPWHRRAPSDPAQRVALVDETLRTLGELGDLGLRAFAVTIPNSGDDRFAGPPPRAALRAIFQRLQVFANRHRTEHYLHLEVQQPALARREARAATRALTAPSSVDPDTYHKLPFESLLEHPREYPVEDSYRMQAASHLSWAALRELRPGQVPVRRPWRLLIGTPLLLVDANRHEREDLGSDELPGLIVLPDRTMPPSAGVDAEP